MAISLKELVPFPPPKERKPKPPVRVTEEKAAKLLRKKINDIIRRPRPSFFTATAEAIASRIDQSEVLFAIDSGPDGYIPRLPGKVKTSLLEREALQKVGIVVMREYGFDPEDFRETPALSGTERIYKTKIEGLEFHRLIISAPRAKNPSLLEWAVVKSAPDRDLIID